MAQISVKQMCTPSGQKKGGRTRAGFVVHFADQPAPGPSDRVKRAMPGLSRITRGPINPNAPTAERQQMPESQARGYRDSGSDFPEGDDD
jgi:hypothetical protein